MTNVVNGIDLDLMKNLVTGIEADPKNAHAQFGVHSKWVGQTKIENYPQNVTLGDKSLGRKGMVLVADEPPELLGNDEGLNPMELLMSALNSCMCVGYVAGAAARGITLTKLEIKTEGDLDLRGFFGMDPRVKPGFDTIKYKVIIAGNGTDAQFKEIHESVRRLSPNRFNVSMPVNLEAELSIE